ncbi:M15 family metallopeptidase [Clostridium frigoris]|uniref:M15 family metallopeptidase n=1 Tax=Clostridium frigoris TaxID=205327 RepID=A0ABS6BS12_9CLOT|nr:M15 family metallopeptidase [Clostridium frigoris]MBU3158638.1 M15 family metallopeptidase [Clostridium frigoris]
MRKMFIVTLIVSLLLNTENITLALATTDTNKQEKNNIYNVTMKQDILCLMMAYPEYIKNIEENNGYVYLIMKSGKKLCYDDKKVKTIQEKLINPDLQDTLEQIYPLSPTKEIMISDFDPGRYRSYGLLHEVYGESKEIIENNLTKVNIIYNNYQFNKKNKASNSLKTVMEEINPILKMDQNLRNCLLPCSGTFNYRVISGTSRLSPHSFGIAIDLASDKRDYWKWATKDAGEKRLMSYSSELVKIFEKNNFVWGGKWSHFDILHFEYRPEIILKARYFSNNKVLKKAWYEGSPIQETATKNAIDEIDSLIK